MMRHSYFFCLFHFLILISCVHAEQESYQSAGVSIEAGDELVKIIAPLAKMTARPGADGSLGGFSGIFDIAKTNYRDPLLLTTTDGVGTKLKLAIALNKHETIGIDLVAMCVNDLLVHGAEPVVFLDYFATGHLNNAQAACVIAGIARGCKQSGCALSGGETAEMPGMYANDDYDLAGFALGLVERSALLPRLADIAIGDVVLGLASSGIHSNGYSLVRRIIAKHNVNLLDAPPFPSDYPSLGHALLAPTIIYVSSLLPLIRQGSIKALAHITGGGLVGNIPRVLPNHCAVELDMMRWEIPPVFSWIASVGNVEPMEMARTFNLGIGMIGIIAPDDVQAIQEALQKTGQQSYLIGTVVERAQQNDAPVIIHNLAHLQAH